MPHIKPKHDYSFSACLIIVAIGPVHLPITVVAVASDGMQLVSVRSVPVGGRRSSQTLSSVVKRVPAKVLVHTEATDAASITTGGWRCATTENGVVVAAAATFYRTATHQRWNRWHWLATSQGGKVTATDSIPAFEQISRVIVTVVIVKRVLGCKKNQ